MKITFITTQQMYWGGSEELWVRSALLAIECNYTVQVIVYSQQGGLHPALEKLKSRAASFIEMKNDVSISSLLDKGIRSIKNRILPPNLKALDRFSPDCVFISQVNSYSAAFHPVIFPFIAKTPIPYFLISQFNTEHECLSYGDIEKARIAFQKSSCNFFVSKRNRAVVERQIAAHVERVVVIDNPLNTTEISYVPYPSNAIVQFASVARLDVNYKGQDILFQIFSSEEWLSKKWHLNMYGSGNDEQYLRDLCEFYKLTDRVTFHGQVKNIREIWSVNHALLMPSIAEGKPLALEEAMVCGRIGIVSDVAGNAELIDNGINGYLASSFLPAPFEEALLKAWSELEQWELMGKSAHTKMNQILDFEPEKTLLSYVNRIDSINNR